MSPSICVRVGALLAGLAVGAGAFGAHFLKERLSPDALAIWEVAVRYQMYHALGLVLVGVWGNSAPAARLRVAAWAFLIGIVVFSGLLYALALTGIKVLGAVVWVGGVALMVGWAAFAWSARPGRIAP